jgi:hypothetical protein
MVSKVNIRQETTHFIRVDITLRPPFAYSLYGYLYRSHGSKSAWSEEEIATLTRLYPKSDRVEVLAALPERTWESIVKQACIMRPPLQRSTRHNSSTMFEGLTYSDYTLAERQNIETLGGSMLWVMNVAPSKNNLDSRSG